MSSIDCGKGMQVVGPSIQLNIMIYYLPSLLENVKYPEDYSNIDLCSHLLLNFLLALYRLILNSNMLRHCVGHSDLIL